MIAVLILAGGEITPDLQTVAEGVTNRALIAVGPNGETQLDYVVEAVRAGLREYDPQPGRILVAGDVPTPAGCAAVAGGKSMVETLMNGVSALRPEETRLLLVTADLPFLTGAAVADFLKQSGTVSPASFVYPIVPATACRTRFPEMKRTTLRIAEGEFTGGNLALLDPVFLRANESALRAAYGRRKDIFALARMLGGGIIVRLLLSRIVPSLLAIRHLEAAVGRILNRAVVRAVITEYAEIGSDVDRPRDVVIARQILAQR